ncbi:E3 ubiquitin-protein ligase makorin-1 [Linnemannia schmuckeri]|uniref:E3 ubiquitin-protein ligase makorin-1 n=1 Tax=Linnemannia schmuckeri TaxID=64567 RepID=A0A9P5VAR8_9FUNG|nr:E3 ubiquitin-protein ligase makorin-1 [Linnemannia schmuckeri]
MRSSEQDRTSVTKACPNCRTQSLFVVPSSYFPSTPEQKEAIIQNYKVVSARRPCKYFKESGERHWCPFGDDCFFAHLDVRGQPCKVNPQSNPRLNRRRDRYGFGGGGIGGGRNLFRRRVGFDGFGGYSGSYGGGGYRSAARQRAHREMMEDLAYIQMSTTNVAHNHLEQIQELLMQLARLGVDDSNFNPHDHTQLRALSEVFEEYIPGDLRDVVPGDYYDRDDGDEEDDFDEDEDEDDYEDEDDFEDEDEEEDDDEDADSETTLERDEREAYEEFGDDLYFQTHFLSSTPPRAQPAAARNPISAYDIDAYHDRIWAEYEDYY